MTVEPGLKELHQNLFRFSWWMIIMVGATVFFKDIIWLSIGGAMGFIYWIGSYFYRSKNIQFPHGPANAITILRLCGLVSVSMMSPALTNLSLGILLAILCLGDILDGYIARTLKMETLIGEYLDKESDAFFVMICSSLLFIRDHFGYWILSLGLIRYAYFIFSHLFQRKNTREIKDRQAKIIAVLVFISLISAFIIPFSYAQPLMAIITLLLIYSFTRGFILEHK